ncbi:MAG TPA: TauD/TfdA family dioxygenase, partial [Ilumatobacteraceae bacterium]|nr:TauD/TfdA family dioxygenase [Ilumatobacteraceae bacterium]
MRHVVGTLRVEPMDATFGAVVHDVVLRDASDATIAELTELWLEYALLVFPGQFMTQDEQDEFARRFGDLEFTATPLTN